MPSPVRVLHFTTHDEECGIAKYQEQFIASMQNLKGVHNVIFEYSPNRTKKMTATEFAPVLKKFARQIADFDIFHVQHEFSFYSQDELDRMVTEAKRQGKKVIITVHTSLYAGIPTIKLAKLATGGPRYYFGTRRLKAAQIKVHITPMRKADLIIVHNSVTADSLVHYGVDKSRIVRLTMPVPELDFKLKSTTITKYLDKQPNDLIYCTVGFVSENKGMRDAVKALLKLPDNYKLAMIGGVHPSGANDQFYKELQELIKEQGLEKRAYLTGYIKQDELLNAMIRECDMCVYPFNQKYYAGVTSASLNNSLANYKPAIAYPTEPILEMNAEMPAVTVCRAFDHSELARSILDIDLKAQTAIAERYARAFRYGRQAVKILDTYKQLLQTT